MREGGREVGWGRGGHESKFSHRMSQNAALNNAHVVHRPRKEVEVVVVVVGANIPVKMV